MKGDILKDVPNKNLSEYPEGLPRDRPTGSHSGIDMDSGTSVPAKIA